MQEYGFEFQDLPNLSWQVLFFSGDQPPKQQFAVDQEIAIKTLLEQLTFIKDKTHWGAAFRFGQLKIPAQDFKLIAEAIGCTFEQDFA